MMKSVLVLSSLLLLAGPAWGDVVVSRRDCDRLVKYEQPPGVEYQAGIDAHGRPVAPADLGGGSTIKAPDIIVIPIEVLVQDRFNIPANSVLWDGTIQAGTVVVKGGQVFYEGQLLGDAETSALGELCREQFPPR